MISIFSAFLFLSASLSAQFYEYGQDAASVKWNTFDSENYTFIYPLGLDSLAMDFADKLEYFYPYQAKVLDWQHKKIPVIFHHESSFSNGVFVWAPRRLEVFTNPDPNGYPKDWMTQLALHEGRHAFQVSKLEQGISKGLSYVAGEQAVGAITGFLPMWYLEGDAVDSETRFSFTGRGRQPEFEMGIRSIVLQRGEPYNFSKALLGSYKDYIPNHYELGYLLVRHGRRNYGDVFWQDFENHAARRPYTIVPTWLSFRKYGIPSKAEFYRQAIDEYTAHWKKVDSNVAGQQYNLIHEPKKKNYTSYRFPQETDRGTVIALKTGMDQIPEFVEIDSSGTEKRIFRPGYMNSGRFSYRDGKIIWDEWVPDIRWSNRNYSEIRVFDLRENRVHNLHRNTRYYAPAFSNDGEKIVAIEQLTGHTFHLIILDVNGNVLRRINAPENQYIQHPAWAEADTAIIVTLSNELGEYLYCYSLTNETWEELLHDGYNDISWPVVSGNEIYFSSTATGINNIFSYHMVSKKLERVTDSRMGAFQPSPGKSSGKLLFSQYSWLGYDAMSYLPNSDGEKLHVSVPDSLRQLDYQSTEEEKKIVTGSFQIEEGNYASSRYRKILHLVNVHSWLPLYFDYMNPEAALRPERIPVSPGISVLSQNLLSTAAGMIGYEYREKMHYLHSGVRLKGRVPVFDISVTYGGKPQVHKINENDDPPVRPDRKLLSFYTYIPLRLNTGKFITQVQPQLRYLYSSDLFPNPQNTGYVSGSHRFQYRIYAGSYLRMGRRDILPRLGISGYVSLLHAPFDQSNLGHLTHSGVTMYLPGFFKHQSVRINLAFQKQEPLRYFMANNISMPRGLDPVFAMQMNRYAADYLFPVAYPDWNIGPILYLKRIQAALWADYMQAKDVFVTVPEPGLTDKNYTTFGADVLFDIHALRIFFPISLGARFAYNPSTGSIRPEMLFDIDIR